MADHGLALARAGRHRQAQELIETLLPKPGSPADKPASKALYTMGVAKRLAGDPGGALRLQQQALQTIAPGRSAELRRMRTLTEIGLRCWISASRTMLSRRSSRR